LLRNNVNGEQHIHLKAIYKTMQLYRTSVHKNTTQQQHESKNMVKLRLNYLVKALVR